MQVILDSQRSLFNLRAKTAVNMAGNVTKPVLISRVVFRYKKISIRDKKKSNLEKYIPDLFT